jgi:excisionase family DNA binding protein
VALTSPNVGDRTSYRRSFERSLGCSPAARGVSTGDRARQRGALEGQGHGKAGGHLDRTPPAFSRRGSPFTRDDAPLGSARPKGASRCTQWPHCVRYENVQGARRVTSIVPGVPKRRRRPPPAGERKRRGPQPPTGSGASPSSTRASGNPSRFPSAHRDGISTGEGNACGGQARTEAEAEARAERGTCACPRAEYDDSDILTTRRVADVFGVSTNTVRRWAEAGMLPSFRTLGGHRRFRWGDVRARSAHMPLAKSAP